MIAIQCLVLLAAYLTCLGDAIHGFTTNEGKSDVGIGVIPVPNGNILNAGQDESDIGPLRPDHAAISTPSRVKREAESLNSGNKMKGQGVASASERLDRPFGPASSGVNIKRGFGMDGSAFHGDTFNDGWGGFSTMRKRLATNARGFHGDTFNSGFGDFSTMKRNMPLITSDGNFRDRFPNDHLFYRLLTEASKRDPMTSMRGFHGDAFSDGFGDFSTMKRLNVKRPIMSARSFHGDTFSDGFGDFSTMKK